MKGGAAGTTDDLLTSTLHLLSCSILYMIKDNFGWEWRLEIAVGRPDWTMRLVCQEGNVSALPKACYTLLCEWQILEDVYRKSLTILIVKSQQKYKASIFRCWGLTKCTDSTDLALHLLTLVWWPEKVVVLHIDRLAMNSFVYIIKIIRTRYSVFFIPCFLVKT